MDLSLTCDMEKGAAPSTGHGPFSEPGPSPAQDVFDNVMLRSTWLENKKDQFKKQRDKLRLSGDKKDDQITQLDEDLDLSRYMNQSLQKQLNEESEMASARHKRDAEAMDVYEKNYNRLSRENAITLQDVDNLNNLTSALQEMNKERDATVETWIGIALRNKFILDEIIKLGALREGHDDWVTPLVEDVVMPEISNVMRNKFLPSQGDQDIEMGDIEEEEETYRLLSEEASEFSNALDQSLLQSQMEEDPDYIKNIIKIQSMWRGYNDRVLKGCRFMPQALITHLRHSEYFSRFWTHRFTDALTGRRTIKFINTGPIPMYVYWVKRVTGKVGPPIQIKSSIKCHHTRLSNNILTQVGHWFMISHDPNVGCRNTEDLRQGGVDMKYIYIGPRFKNSSIFDVRSGFTFTDRHWSALSNTIINGYARSVIGPIESVFSQEDIVNNIKGLEGAGLSHARACWAMSSLMIRYSVLIKWTREYERRGIHLIQCYGARGINLESIVSVRLLSRICQTHNDSVWDGTEFSGNEFSGMI